MAINPLMVNGTIMNSQDISIYKINDDNRAVVAQSAVVEETEQENIEQSTRVNEFANAAEGGEGFDAKEHIYTFVGIVANNDVLFQEATGTDDSMGWRGDGKLLCRF